MAMLKTVGCVGILLKIKDHGYDLHWMKKVQRFRDSEHIPLEKDMKSTS